MTNKDLRQSFGAAALLFSSTFSADCISVIKHKKTPPKLCISTKIIRCTQKHLQGVVLCAIMRTDEQDEQINATTAHNFSLLVDCVLLFNGGDIVLLTIQQVADRLQLSKATVRNRIKDGSLKAIKLGYNTLRVEESELEKFIRSLTQ